MNMKKKGWIKLERKELEWMKDLSDAEFRYYVSARLITVWDKRSGYFGTFDCRTEDVKEDMLLSWSNGKINGVKKSLMGKGLLKQLPRYRAELTNADVFLSKGRDIESFIQETECNLQRTENYVQKTESRKQSIDEMKKGLLAQYKVKKADHIQ